MNHTARVTDVANSPKRDGSPTKKTGAAPEGPRRSLTWQPLLLIAAGAIAYHNSFSGAFVFDDAAHIHTSQRITALWPIWPLLGGRRPVVDVTLAINYALGEYEAWGYHLLNLVVHLLTVLTLFGIVRRTLLLEPLRARYADSSIWLATAVGLVWVVHPLNTQAVTYIIQRGESLMSLFYLSTLYFLIRGSTSRHGRMWFAAATIVCGLGMGCKAVMMTAPVAVLLYDRSFLSGSFGRALRHRRWMYAGLFASIGILYACGVLQSVLSTTPGHDPAVGLGFKGISPLQYALTEPGVLLYYLRLAVWPVQLCFDYAWPVARTAREIVPAATAVVALLILTVWAVVRHPRVGFIGAWFFLILAPTSSIMPIRDPLVEHRMYLPLAAVLLLILLAGEAMLVRKLEEGVPRSAIWRGGTVCAVMALVTVLTNLTVQRNKVYASELVLWQDVAAKRPGNARGFLNLGTASLNLRDAVRAYETALAIDPDYADAHFNLGQAYRAMGELDAAGAAYRRAAEADPALGASANLNLGLVLTKQGRLEESARAFHRCLEIDPSNYKARFNLGNLAARAGRNAQAIEQFEASVELAPMFAQARVNLARVQRRVGRSNEARQQLELALRLLPEHQRAGVHVQLGSILAHSELYGEAIAQYEAALRFDPNHAGAKRGMAELKDVSDPR